MKDLNQTDIGKLTNDWNGIDSIVPYGAGIVGNICKKMFGRLGIDIPFVIDQDKNKQGLTWINAPIISFEQAKKQLEGKKIVVMAAHDAYGKISFFLEENGLKEFRDFCNVGLFVSEWLWLERGMNCVFHVDMTITTRCTLNCKNCNLFMPYYKEKRDYSFNELQESIDLLFERIDFVAHFGLIGGETFLHPELVRIIEYLGNNYHDKIGQLAIVTNGTIKPSDDLLEAIKKYDVFLSISDYTGVVSYADKMKKLIELVTDYDIDYYRNDHIVWTEFGFPLKPYNRNPKELKIHLESCRPDWNAIHDGKFFYCNVSWSAEESGRYTLCPQDYIEMKTIDATDKEECREIVRLSRGTSSFCAVCGGCGKDNNNYVETGVQISKSKIESS